MKLSNDNEKGFRSFASKSFRKSKAFSKSLEKTKSVQKIAISTDNGEVSEHFGRCPEFTIAEIKDDKIIKKEVIENPGHRTGFLPKFFSEQGINCVIAGGAGFRAQQFFEEFEIKLITGVQGKVDDVIDDFVNGELERGESLCKPGKGEGYGLEKKDGHHKD